MFNVGKLNTRGKTRAVGIDEVPGSSVEINF